MIEVEENLRPADFEEFVMSTGRHPRGVFRQGVADAYEAHCGLVDGRPACVFGLSFDGDTPAPWFMGTPAIEGRDVTRVMLREGRRLFRSWAKKFGPLRHWAYAKNDLHIRYIEALGCEVKPPAPRGPLLAPFREFTYRV